MKTISILFIFYAVCCFSEVLVAQERIIHGIVTTFDSIPVIGAEIKVKSTKQVVQTDTLGKFAVGVALEEKIKISANGFYGQRIKIPAEKKLVIVNLKLKPTEKAREYAIAYGHVTDVDKLNSMSNLRNGDIDFSQYTNLYEVIRGRFPGVQVMSNGEIIIRGLNSILGSNAALIIVDGMPVENNVLGDIPPIQVKSINIIKDGSSAMYGVRGANGVVIIETKRGSD